MDILHSYTDGSSLGNPGPSGWAVLQDGVMHSGPVGINTNNYAEAYAALQAMTLAQPNTHLVIHTDSKLVLNWLSGQWRINSPDIQAIVRAFHARAIEGHKTFEMLWVKGHGDDMNNRSVDKAAKLAALSRVV